MRLPSGVSNLLAALPESRCGDLAWQLLDAAGAVVDASAGAPEVQYSLAAGNLAATPPAGWHAVLGPPDASGTWICLLVAAARKAQLTPIAEAALALTRDIDRLEQDLEGMYPSSLALLEEVSMVNEILPRLPTGESERDVAEMGLRALLVAASIDAASYIRLYDDRPFGEVLVHVANDGEGRTLEVPYAGDPVVSLERGIVARAITGSGDAILETVPAGGTLGEPGSPESFAARQVIAVPVRYGDPAKTRTLGVLLFLDKRANSYSNSTEFGSNETKLAGALASMLGSVLGARKVAELGKELEMAQTIQRQILPQAPAKVAGFEIVGHCTTSGAVGGDYYDYLPMADGRTLVVVADVSGHNLASGMLMVSARATLRLLASLQGDVVDVFDDLGACLYPDLSRTERFITAIGVGLRPGGRTVEIVSAGHNEALLFRAGARTLEPIRSESTILGFMQGVRHESRCLELQPGDAILLYTDGITEAIDTRGEMFGEERLIEVFRRVAHGPSQAALDAVLAAVEAFADPAAHRDDVTAVVIRAVPT